MKTRPFFENLIKIIASITSNFLRVRERRVTMKTNYDYYYDCVNVNMRLEYGGICFASLEHKLRIEKRG